MDFKFLFGNVFSNVEVWFYFIIFFSYFFFLVSLKDLSFFKLEFTPCKAEQPLQGMKQQEKEAQMKSVYNEPTVKKMFVNSRLKATKIIGQRKAF